ncbi:phosphotransferase [Dyella sp. 20L07]|uniref:phosphotransferase n=1 Tax=Dyella sp. 20L07 TaxID=3384240 RepID=UPI003D2C0E71
MKQGSALGSRLPCAIRACGGGSDHHDGAQYRCKQGPKHGGVPFPEFNCQIILLLGLPQYWCVILPMHVLTPDAALMLAERHWRVHGDISALPSYADQNFRIRTGDGDYVLKVAHPSWSHTDLELENLAMMTLAERESALEWPRVQHAINGGHLLTLPIAGEPRLVRLLSFVPGNTYAEAIGALSLAQREALHESLGRAVGMLTRGLQDFHHPAADRQHDWNLMRLPDLLDEVPHIEDVELRVMVQTKAGAFCAELPAWSAQLPVRVLHNDANDLNVIVADNSAGEKRVSAVIDFGDMCTSFRLADLAIACTYAMQHEKDPVACAQRIVRGYLAEYPLLHLELEQLHNFIMARLCHSILMATRAHREQPDNPFVLVSQQGVRALLRQLVEVDNEAIVRPFLDSSHD